MNALLPLLLCLCQDPTPPSQAPAPPATARGLDIVELVNGDQFEGRITAEIDGYIELELGAGATVGLSRAEVKAIRRGLGRVAPTSTAVVPPSSQWFVLYDARGLAVGWLHTTVSNSAEGLSTIGEEYEFQDGRRRYQVTSLCTADADWTPQTCYFRERISDPALATVSVPGVDGQPQRIGDERIVEAASRGGQLVVTHLDRSGRTERTFDWGPDSTFPLLARARARTTGAAAPDAIMFDPATEELGTRSFDAARLRRVVVDGKPLQITEIAENSASGRNAEWLDASARTIRRELAGPALVAMPSSAESARLAVGGATQASAIASEPGGNFGLWVPNPAWQVREGLPKGQVALVCEAHAASIGLSRLDHLAPDTPLDTAADAVANWFALLHPDLRIESREPSLVRDRAALRLSASGRVGGTQIQATVDVIPNHGEFLVLVCRAPRAAWQELAADFEFLRRTIELSPQGLAPTLQGPLAERPAHGKAPRPPVRPPAGPVPAAGPVPGPIVRIPKDG
ncbi:MAG TPA: hypothetical protein VFZ65_08520 [Planctomycetota bacterium]|nr:hypothetical protein [Planctomycetota bacterium]